MKQLNFLNNSAASVYLLAVIHARGDIKVMAVIAMFYGIIVSMYYLVQAWLEIHQEELIADWALASSGETVFKIDPLK